MLHETQYSESHPCHLTCRSNLAAAITSAVAGDPWSRHGFRHPPDGVFVFSILRPAFYSRQIVEDPGGERYRKIPDYLTHETRQVTSFGEHHHYPRIMRSSALRGPGSDMASRSAWRVGGCLDQGT